jgi:hypothetical protein
LAGFWMLISIVRRRSVILCKLPSLGRTPTTGWLGLAVCFHRRFEYVDSGIYREHDSYIQIEEGHEG